MSRIEIENSGGGMLEPGGCERSERSIASLDVTHEPKPGLRSDFRGKRRAEARNGRKFGTRIGLKESGST